MRRTVSPRTWANICVSESDGASALGRDSHQINSLTCAFSSFLLNRGFRLLFGHDWREDGVMRSVATLAEATTDTYTEPSINELPRLLNLVPKPWSGMDTTGLRVAKDSGGVLGILSLIDLMGTDTRFLDSEWLTRLRSDRIFNSRQVDLFKTDPIYCNWMLRYALSVVGSNGVRICLGGKTSNYSGMYAGLAEEAWLAILSKMPLYLVAGFGGTTAAVAKCFSTEPSSLYIETVETDPLAPKGIKPVRGEVRKLGRGIGMPIDGLRKHFTDYGLSRLSSVNGLNEDENERLFRATDTEEIFRLIEHGLQSLILQGRFEA